MKAVNRAPALFSFRLLGKFLRRLFRAAPLQTIIATEAPLWQVKGIWKTETFEIEKLKRLQPELAFSEIFLETFNSEGSGWGFFSLLKENESITKLSKRTSGLQKTEEEACIRKERDHLSNTSKDRLACSFF